MFDIKFRNSEGAESPALHADMPALGQPQPPNILQAAPAPIRTSPSMAEAFVNVRARSRGGFDAMSTSQQIRQRFGPGTMVTSNIRDNRQRMTSQKIQDLLDRA